MTSPTPSFTLYHWLQKEATNVQLSAKHRNHVDLNYFPNPEQLILIYKPFLVQLPASAIIDLLVATKLNTGLEEVSEEDNYYSTILNSDLVPLPLPLLISHEIKCDYNYR